MNQDTMTKEQREFENALIEHEKELAPEPKCLDDLAWVGRAIRALEKQIDMTNRSRASEIEKIAACAGHIIEKKQEQMEALTLKAMAFLHSEGYQYDDKKKRKFQIAGIGTFAFSTTMESVNADDYNEMTIEQKEAWHKKRPEFTIKKESINPVKAAIKAAIQEGKEVPGFSINQKQETFKFKGEQ